MSDLNWCTFCDKAISVTSNSLYCSEECLRSDALNHHPLLGYDYAEFKDFPRSSFAPSPALSSSSSSSISSSASSTRTFHSCSPSLLCPLPSPQQCERSPWPSPPLLELDNKKTVQSFVRM